MNGKLIVISGFSGSGKGTIVDNILKKREDIALSISCATREKRKKEIDGVHYFFITKDKFEDMIKHEELLEYAKYADNYYGTPKKYVLDKLSKNINIILEIEQQGALQVKNMYEEAILIFITTKDFTTLKNRLTGRGTENEQTLINRFNMALSEAEVANKYDYILVNDTIEETVDTIIGIIDEKIIDIDNNSNLQIINNIKEDIRRYLNV